MNNPQMMCHIDSAPERAQINQMLFLLKLESVLCYRYVSKRLKIQASM